MGDGEEKGSRSTSNCRVKLTRLLSCMWLLLAMQASHGQLRVRVARRGGNVPHGLQVHV
ncbi:hypothetical protein SLEP1_g16065 [Rubroshorea leprosula]|uniref:Uncharacterized protein n=1 Tax=Rubroshorea leprosula TaxID=152421 RepID=A0AAV5IYN2_9ROSI|nr:hypothetical protein SLEP1_g16065 [Rubroshorea leprosula]